MKPEFSRRREWASSSPLARFLSKCFDCSSQKVVHIVTHTLQTFNFRQKCYIINITSMPMYEGGVVHLTYHFKSGNGISLISVIQLVNAFDFTIVRTRFESMNVLLVFLLL